jgi:hypothetical protein
MDAHDEVAPVEPVRKSPPDWRREKKPDAWAFAGARQAGKWEERWPLLTESEFDAAIAAAGDIRIG